MPYTNSFYDDPFLTNLKQSFEFMWNWSYNCTIRTHVIFFR